MNLSPLNLSAGGSSAPLAAFVRDEETRATLVAALGAEWPSATVNPGGINEAVVHLAADPSARTLIVDVSDAPDVLKAFDRLAEVCTPGTQVIALGEVNDVGLYRRLRAAGIADYLVKPVTAEAFSHALHAASQPAMAMGHDRSTKPKGDVVAVVGARGGVGTTMVATTIAWLFAEEAKRKTMLIDLDVRWGTSGLALDVETSHGLCEVLANPERIDSLFVSSAAARIGDRLSLLASEEPIDTGAEARPGALELLLKEARRESERVVLDVPRLGGEMLRRAFAEASMIIIVTDFSLAGLRDAGRILALAKDEAPTANIVIIGNRAGAHKKSELPRAEVEKALKMNLAAVIAEEQGVVLEALNTGKALPHFAPRSKAVAALRTLVQNVDRVETDETGFFARLFGGKKTKGAGNAKKEPLAAAG